jgi:hypothetical protein
MCCPYGLYRSRDLEGFNLATQKVIKVGRWIRSKEKTRSRKRERKLEVKKVIQKTDFTLR